MVTPSTFGFDVQTFATDPFEHVPRYSEKVTRNEALRQFRRMVKRLRSNGIRVLILQSRNDVITPDAVFPNNWFSSHARGRLVIYPMLAPVRRAERRIGKLGTLLKSAGIKKQKIIDLTADEKKLQVLEGTGSLVLDREHHVAFALASQRTSEAEFRKWCKLMGYRGVFFHAYMKKRFPIYHTNIVMCIGKDFAVVCLAAIRSKKTKERIKKELKNLGKQVIPITLKQLYSFCGNLIQLVSTDGETRIVLSRTADEAFTKMQKKELKNHGKFVIVDIPTIEKVGGGSARCMIAEVFA